MRPSRMRSTAGKLAVTPLHARRGLMEHPSSRRRLPTQTGLIGRLDAFGAHFRHKSSSLFDIVLRSGAAGFAIDAGDEQRNSHATVRMKVRLSGGDAHRRAVAAGDERARSVRHAWRTRRDRRRDLVHPRRARRPARPRESRPARERPPMRRPRGTAPSG